LITVRQSAVLTLAIIVLLEDVENKKVGRKRAKPGAL
jgi:hypothetical protein